MGVTTVVAACVWLAGGFIEYKVVSSIPWLKIFFRGIPGMVISLAIGWIIGRATGAHDIAGGFVIGQFFGLATNQFTFRSYSKAAELNERKNVQVEKYRAFKTEHAVVYREAKTTVWWGLKIVGALFYCILWLIGSPIRLIKMATQRRLNPS